MKLSKYFTLEDLTVTQTGLPNNPTPAELENLRKLGKLLDSVVDTIGPVVILSGFRAPAVNSKVGGAGGSLHLTGMAADIFPTLAPSTERFFGWIYNSWIMDELGELAYKPSQNAIHISLPTEWLKGRVTILKGNSYESLTPTEVAQYSDKSKYFLAGTDKKPLRVLAMAPWLALVGAASLFLSRFRNR